MQVDVYIIENGRADVVVERIGLDVTVGDDIDVAISDQVVESPTGEILECVEGPGGPMGRPARADVTLSWAGTLRDGEELPGLPITHPTRFTNSASWGFARRPASATCSLQICNRTPENVIGAVVWDAGENEPSINLTGGAYAAQRGDFLFLKAPAEADATLADAGVTLAGETVQ